MASKINSKCIVCGDCFRACPTGSIYQGGQTFVVDSDTCLDCMTCIPICPVDAIENPLKAQKEEKNAKDASKGKDAAKSKEPNKR